MLLRRTILMLVLLIAASSRHPAAQGAAQTPTATAEVAPFALVELFTSQGCSSCPPADRVLSSLVAAAKDDGRRVYALSFHVDYWNRLGWTDPYSQQVFTQRQRLYARAQSSMRIYTPQMVVNGQVEFVGSNAAKAQQAVAWALTQKPQGSLAVAVTLQPPVDREPRQVTVKVQASDVPRDAAVHIALVQDSGSNDVPAGENAGRRLRHDNIVRALVTAPGGDEPIVRTLALPAGLTPADVRIIVYAQSPRTMQIHCVAAANVVD